MKQHIQPRRIGRQQWAERTNRQGQWERQPKECVLHENGHLADRESIDFARGDFTPRRRHSVLPPSTHTGLGTALLPPIHAYPQLFSCHAYSAITPSRPTTSANKPAQSLIHFIHRVHIHRLRATPRHLPDNHLRSTLQPAIPKQPPQPIPPNQPRSRPGAHYLLYRCDYAEIYSPPAARISKIPAALAAGRMAGMDEGALKVGIQALFAFFILLFLVAAVWPAWRKQCRWGKTGKGASLSIYGALAWAGLFAAGLIALTFGDRWAFSGAHRIG